MMSPFRCYYPEGSVPVLRRANRTRAIALRTDVLATLLMIIPQLWLRNSTRTREYPQGVPSFSLALRGGRCDRTDPKFRFVQNEPHHQLHTLSIRRTEALNTARPWAYVQIFSASKRHQST
jgi:hypothetical protein